MSNYKDGPTEQLIKKIREAIDSFDCDMPIATNTVANMAYDAVDPDGVAPSLVKWGCVLELRQLARNTLRNLGEEADENSPQAEMFTGLQARYPVERDGQILSVPMLQMLREEWILHIERLAREGQAKLKHSNALRAKLLELEKQGWFDKQQAQ